MNFTGLDDHEVERLAQELAESHLDACEDALACTEGYCDEDCGHTESPAVGPFCGCRTCVVREVLHAAYPALAELARRSMLV